MQLTIRASRLGRLRWNQDYADIAMAVGLAVLAVVTMATTYHRLDVLSTPLLLLETLPIAFRRRNPMRTLYVTGSAITIYSILGYPDANGYLGIFVAFYTVAANETRRRATVAAIITAGGILVSFGAYTAFNNVSGWSQGISSTYLAYGLAWLIGDNLRVRRAYTRELEERARDLEREQVDQAAQAVALERARIARELHDVVAHHVSVMVVQAAGARRVIDKDPAAARAALGAVEEAGRTALAEMRRMLEVLRTDEAGVGPQPGLAELERLVGQVREAGLPVDLVIEGPDRMLPVGMDLAAYRIVQEALTNAVKHAGKATARVSVRYAPDALEIEVTDDGRGAAAPLLPGAASGGHGLIGMNERVTLYGGKLETGPLFPGGYRVAARFPLEPHEKGSLATCCDEESALSAVATAALRDRLKRGALSASAATPEPEPLVSPRVVPALILRVVPPHRTTENRPKPAARPPRNPGAAKTRKGET
jgi:signal transduction histidine kinase